MLVNVVDVPPLCNFILPAIVRTGPLAVAISTAGASPALAKRMKREIGELFGEPYAHAGGAAQRRPRLGQGDAAHLPGPQGVLRVDRQRRSRPDRAAARGEADRVRELIESAQRPRPPPGDRERRRMSELTHLDADGRAPAWSTSATSRPPTRRAVARAVVRVSAADRAQRVQAGDAPKGDVIGVARIAGIQAAKRTSELIPLCHPLALSFVGVEGEIDVEAGEIELIAEARTTGPTGVEMEALTAASVAALTVYDMVKGVERGAEIAPCAAREVRRALGRSGAALSARPGARLSGAGPSCCRGMRPRS